MDWIIHLDTDELLHPAGTREYSLRQLLSDVPRTVDMVIFPNYVSESALSRIHLILLVTLLKSMLVYCLFQESSVERDDIKEPFSEV